MSIKKNYGFNLFNALLNIAFPIISFPYAARILSPEGIGKTMFIFSFAQYFALIAAFGIPIYGVKVVAAAAHNQKALNKVSSELISLSGIITLTVLAIYLLCVSSIPRFQPDLPAYIVAGVLVAFSVLNVDWFFGGIEKFKWIALRALAVKSLSLVLLFVLVQNGEDTFGYLIFLLFLYVGNYIVNFFLLTTKVTIRWTLKGVKVHFMPLLMIFSMTLATTIYTTLDTVLLGFLSNETQVGLYTAAVKLAKVSIPIMTSLGVVVIPRAMHMMRNQDLTGQLKLYQKSFAFIAFLAIPISLGIYATGEEAILLFSGQAFSPAGAGVKVLALLPLLIGIGHFVAFQILIPFDKNKGMFVATFIGMLVFAVLSFTLIPSYGSTGMAWANLSTELVVTLCYFLFVPAGIWKQLPWKELPKALVIALFFLPIHWGIQSMNLTAGPTFGLSVLLCGTFYLAAQHYFFKNPMTHELLGNLQNKWKNG